MHANGGIAAVAERMRRLGRDGDTILAHINPQEARALMQMGGRGTVNPATGAIEFAREDTFDADLYAARNADVVAAYGNDPAALFQHYQDFGRSEGRVGNQREIEAREEGYAGEFGGGGYDIFREDDDQIQDVVGRAAERENPERAEALHRALIDEYGYGGDFGEGGFSAFTRVQDPERQAAIGQYVSDFRRDYAPQGPPSVPGFIPSGTKDMNVQTPLPMPMAGGVAMPGGIETVGVSRSPVTTGDIMRPIDYSPAATSFDAAMRKQGVGTRYYVLVMGQDGNLFKKYVTSNTPGAQVEYAGVYGTVGGEHDFYPDSLGGVPEELDVAGLLGLDKDT